MQDDLTPFQSLVSIIASLRDPVSGCPWDLKQSHASLKPYLIEEAYELLEAIDEDDPARIAEELGDVLLQVMLHSQIASDAGKFSVDDVILKISDKLVERHPHVFGADQLDTPEEVEKRWEQIKRSKSTEKDTPAGLLSGMPRGIPALLRAQRIGERTERVGFDWDSTEGVVEKIDEEIKELLELSETQTDFRARQKEEFGDLMFTLVQLARKWGFDSEDALNAACQKFTDRFSKMETLAKKPLEQLTAGEKEALWDEVKAVFQKSKSLP